MRAAWGVGRGAALVIGLVLAGARGAAAQRQAGAERWRDTTHHRVGFVTVARGVRLHYLDFGGTGPAVVMLAGLGNTAHAFDDFAPRLVDRFHVVAITRRGFGESSHPKSGYDTRRLVEDIRVAMDSLHIAHALFIGHSIAGEELTRLAATYPARVDKLVYLDAAYDRVAADSMLDALFPVPPNVPSPPVPTEDDVATPAAYVAFVHRTRGVDIPESDIRTRYRYDGWDEQSTVAFQAIQPERPNYRAVHAPALAIYAVTDSTAQLEPWERGDREHAAGIEADIRAATLIERASRDEFSRGVANSEVLELHGGHHWIFVSQRDVVLDAVRRFLSK